MADTIDKIDPTDLARCVAAGPVMAYVVADRPERLPADLVDSSPGRSPLRPCDRRVCDVSRGVFVIIGNGPILEDAAMSQEGVPSSRHPADTSYAQKRS